MAPHRTQLMQKLQRSFTQEGWPSFISIARLGQRLAQAAQPMHVSLVWNGAVFLARW